MTKFSGSYDNWSLICRKISDVFDDSVLPLMQGDDVDEIRKPLIQALLLAGAMYRRKLEENK